MITTPEQKKRLSDWFTDVQGQIIAMLEELEIQCDHPSLAAGQFDRTPWRRKDQVTGGDGGGGTMGLMKGRVFEKGGVNVSTVEGQFCPEFASQIPGGDKDPHFWASGVSLVIHPRNPYVPIIHMNTRHIVTSKSWFGGGIDLTPAIEFEEDTKDFHAAMKAVCDRHGADYYDKFRAWSDKYFYLPHRQEMRGVSGIFYDNLNTGDFEADFAFTQDVGRTFIDIYRTIVSRRMTMPWGEAEKEKQLKKRGRYVEFNLIYDRGTKFGLMTNGNTDAILMSLPPVATWA